MTKYPVISVIIPVYKVEAYLGKCVRSVLAQTYPALEIILVDDGSPDACGDMCDAFAREDARIRVIHQANGGLSAARNAGIEAAGGDYIAFLDSDDWLEPDAYETMLAAVRESGADMALCGLCYEYEDGRPAEVLLFEAGGDARTLLPDRTVLTAGEALQKLVEPRAVLYVIACGRLCRRELFKNIRFPLGKLHEDEFTAHEVLSRAEKTVCVQKAFYHYLQRSGSITKNYGHIRHLDGAEALYERYHFYEENGYAALLPQAFRAFASTFTVGIRDGRAADAAQKARLAEVCRMAKELVRRHPDVLSGKEKLALTHPKLWILLFRLKGFLRGK